MLILAIDTAGSNGSISLLGDGKVLELVPLAGRTYSEQLMPQISALLARHKLGKRAIDAYAAATGPGSFTGLRVGLSTIKALAEITHKPIAAVSLLEALAWAGARDVARLSEPGTADQPFKAQVIAALDAMRGEVYVGEYVVREDAVPQLLREVLMPVQEFAAEAQLAPQMPVITPDESVASLLLARGQPVQVVARPQSDVIARIGALKIAAGQVILPEALDANYIRRSDAEIFSKGSS
ncbi:MAG: tRNA (adenosine(37)-N6)-threonylcarbamoyltransferase complex dimerization subunit type 1 TsaB [Acidobacteriia bacterium]|nr:tRNA (adenosine(37)-N6)-threonylcarbamoyltransferase complex dimerization subunit type 1 TsaB [Terriglobia bacterium]